MRYECVHNVFLHNQNHVAVNGKKHTHKTVISNFRKNILRSGVFSASNLLPFSCRCCDYIFTELATNACSKKHNSRRNNRYRRAQRNKETALSIFLSENLPHNNSRPNTITIHERFFRIKAAFTLMRLFIKNRVQTCRTLIKFLSTIEEKKMNFLLRD